MKLRFKFFAVLFALLAITWLMPPETLIGCFTTNAQGITDTANKLSDNSLQAPPNEKAIAAAAKKANSDDFDMNQIPYDLDSSNIVGEDTSRRDKYTKHFRMADGTFQAVLYDTPVHYQDASKQWKEVDNTLVKGKNKSGDTVYKTKDNGYMDVSFASGSKDGDLVSISKDKYKLSWKVTDAIQSDDTKKTNEEKEKPISETPSTDIETKVPEETPLLSPTPESEKSTESPDMQQAALPIETGEPVAVADITQTLEASPTPSPTPEPTATPEPADGKVKPVDAKVVNDIATLKASRKGNALKRMADKVRSHIKYTSIMQNVDMEYVVEAQRIKEYITLSEYIPNYSVSFDISADGLTTKEIEGGITVFCDGKDEVFYLMPSYATDNGGIDCPVNTKLEPIEGGYRLTLEPNDAWMQKATYPVVIDPQIDVDWSRDNIQDTYVASLWPNGVNNDGTNGPWYTYASLRIGYSSSYGQLYGLVKYTNLPVLKSSEAVVGAYMITERDDGESGDYQFNIHKITSSWSQTAVTWNTKPTFSSVVEDSHIIGDSSGVEGSFYTWDVTNLMKSWYDDPSSNYGLMIKGVSTSAGYRMLYSANATYVADAVRTVIQYVNTAGLEDYWSYQSADVRRAGTANVNLFTGNLVVSHNDIGTSGNRMPVSISHVYNAVDKDTNLGFGNGWRTNFHQTISSITISGVLYYKYTDEDGTINYFKQNGSTFDDESGQNRVLELNKVVTDIQFPSGSTYNYVITDKYDNVHCFDNEGRIVRIRDSVGNYITIDYAWYTRISCIKDGAGREYWFGYYDNLDLQCIVAPGNRITTFGYDGNHRLTTITYTDNLQTTYSYNTSGILDNTINRMQNYDRYAIDISYTSTTYKYPKVSGILEWGDVAQPSTTQGGSQQFIYGQKQTKVIDHLGNVNIYQFNQYGNAVTIQDNEGRAVYCQYYNATSTTPNGGTYGQNKMSLSSRLQEPVMNYFKDPSFETGSNWSVWQYAGGIISRPNDVRKFGEYSLSVYNTSSTMFNSYVNTYNVEKGVEYVLSAWVRTQNIVTSSAGARIQVRYYDVNGNENYVFSNYLTGTNDWTRLDCSFTVPANASTNQIYVFLLQNESTGTAWFDGVQLEKASTASRLNLLENGDMTYSTGGVPDGWTKNGACTSSDVATTTADTGRGKLDNNVFKFDGSATAGKTLVQTVMVSGVAGDTYSFGVWAKANSIPLTTQKPNGGSYTRYFSLKIEMYSGTTQVTYKTAAFNTFSNDWQYLSGRAVASGTYDRVRITLMYYNNENDAYFDGVQLFKEEFGQGYDYDANGNLVTAKDLSSSTDTITYNADDEPTSLKPPDCSDTEKYTATYYTGNQKHLVDTATTVEGVKSKYFYDTYGNTTQAETQNDLTNPTIYVRKSATYTSNGNYIDQSYDERGNYTQYSYDTNFGVNDSTTAPNQQVVNYTYDKSTTKLGRLTGASSTVGSNVYSNSYGYTNDYLTSITHNGFNYAIGYNPFGQTTSVNVAGQNLVTNSYITSDRSYLLDYLTYSNNGKVDYSYDNRYRVNAITYDNESSPRYSYKYASNGQLGYINDNQNNLITKFYYDLADRPMKTDEKYNNMTRSFQYQYDIDNCLTDFLEFVDSISYSTKLKYDKDNRIRSINYNSQAEESENIRYQYDPLGRLETLTLETGATDYVVTYYPVYVTNNMTTNMTECISYNGSSALYYSYDSCGRICLLYNGSQYISYRYDGLGQLIRVDDQTSSTSWTYEYDQGGNITTKKLYACSLYDDDISDNPVLDIFTYTYDTTWKDKLTSYDGNAITYDAIGNPLTYNGWTYTWEAGRQLKQMSNGTTTLQYKYNDAGLRTQKINGSTTTKYYWAGKNVSHMTDGTNTLHFWFDASGQPAMVTYNGTNYYYKLNLQGDIIGLLDMTGAEVVSYTYDSWGKPLSCTGSLASTLGSLNPFRYRGYIYDGETGLYYLQSRYYNPEWGRFINADNVLGTTGGLLTHNLFAYCRNNPINLSDPNGKCPNPSCYLFNRTPDDIKCPVCGSIDNSLVEIKRIDSLIKSATGSSWGLTKKDKIKYNGSLTHTIDEKDAFIANMTAVAINGLLFSALGKGAAKGKWVGKHEKNALQKVKQYNSFFSITSGIAGAITSYFAGGPAVEAGTYTSHYVNINDHNYTIIIAPDAGEGAVINDYTVGGGYGRIQS